MSEIDALVEAVAERVRQRMQQEEVPPVTGSTIDYASTKN